MDKEKALQVLDGLLLGDGNLQRYRDTAVYHMSQSKRPITMEDHLKWEYWLRDNVFAALGIKATAKPYWRTYSAGPCKGQKYQLAQLWTESSPLLAPIYDEWYCGGSWTVRGYMCGAAKMLPRRLVEASLLQLDTIVQWFLGDGGSSWHHTERPTPGVMASFSAYRYTKEEVTHLACMLNNMGIKTTSGSKFRIHVAQDSINYFMSLIEPFVMEIFGNSVGPSYKDVIKYRTIRKL